jgi:hypothetical protein
LRPIARPLSLSSMGLFSRRPKLPPQHDWAPGDIAECIGVRWRGAPARQPGQGATAIVLHVREGTMSSGRRGWSLDLLGYPGLWRADAFRTVTPPTRTAERVAVEPVTSEL